MNIKTILTLSIAAFILNACSGNSSPTNGVREVGSGTFRFSPSITLPLIIHHNPDYYVIRRVGCNADKLDTAWFDSSAYEVSKGQMLSWRLGSCKNGWTFKGSCSSLSDWHQGTSKNWF